VAGAHQPGDADNRTLLSVYLNDHLAGAVGGTELARRLARGHRGTDFEAELQQIAGQIRDDLDSLRQIMNRLGIRPVWYKAPLAMVTERVSRLKLNGQLRGRSPLSTLIELEAMQLGVHGKTSGWRTLRELADTVPGLDPEQLDRLLVRAHDQLERLERMRVTAAGRALGRMDHQHPG
jgi:hypothetical protein